MLKVLCDFDGTTARSDVGSLLFRTFSDGSCHEIVRRWKAGEISSRECLIEECRATTVTRAQLETFIDEQDLDPHFAGFVRLCKNHGIEVEVVSDGLDFYVERILKNHKLDSAVEARANHLIFEKENGIQPEFPYFDDGCGHCGNCKGLHVRNARKNHDRIVYVGDGMSDRCGAEEADIVFAKRGRDLLRYCQENRITHFEYSDFGDVQIELERILQAPPA